MIIHKQVTQCDMTGGEYPGGVDGIAYLSQGASGRWCEVLWGGPEEKARIQKDGAEILTDDEARNRIAESGNGWPDF